MDSVIKQETNIFNFNGNDIKVLIINGEPWWNVNDVANALGFNNPRQAIISHVENEDVQKFDTLTGGGKQLQNYVNEPGLYGLIFGSTKDEAKRFKKWVTNDVLPQIRKTGGYSVKPEFKLPDFTNPAESARAWAEQWDERELAEEKVVLLEDKIEKDKPKLLLAETLLSLEDGDGLIKPKDFAKAIESIYGVGRNTFYQILRDIKVWNKDNIPYARFVQAKYFSVKNGTFYNKYTRQEEATMVVFITPKGRQYLVGKLNNLFDTEEI